MKGYRKQVGWSIFLAVLVLIMTLLGSWDTFLGTPKSRLEADARKSQQISDDWQCVSAVNDQVAGLLFYDETQTDFVYSVYGKRPGFSFGYFFHSGGSRGEIMRGVQAYDHQKNRLLLSMNQLQVAQIVLNEGEAGETRLAIDPEQPFAYLLPAGTEILALYDQQGQMVPLAGVEIF